MKEFYFVVILGVVFNSEYMIGQSNSPIIGYDKVVWGATIENVRQFYPDIKEVNNKKIWIANSGKTAPSGVRVFIQGNVSGGINKRYFSFFQDKLYAVDVDYSGIEEALGVVLYNRLISTYGRFNNEVVGTDLDSGLKFFIRNYNRNLTITLSIGVTINDILGASKNSIGSPDRQIKTSGTAPLKNVQSVMIYGESSGKYIYSHAAVSYQNPTVIKQLEDARDKEQNDKIQL